jgi:hypothetical protein
MNAKKPKIKGAKTLSNELSERKSIEVHVKYRITIMINQNYN